MSNITNYGITEFMNSRYKDYALYLINNRAIPAITDGMKTVQRKALHTGLQNIKKGNPIKVAALTGFMTAKTKYHHGDAAGNDAITTMAQEFAMAIPYFKGVGEFGSLYSPHAGAPRYIEVDISDVQDLLYKDSNLYEYNEEEGVTIEPKTFLPIIPTVLCNATQGMAIGYASNITSRNPLQLIDACIDYVKDGKLEDDLQLMPFYKGAIGEYVWWGGAKIEHFGFLKVLNDTDVEITGIPVKHTFESFEEHLNKLVDKGSVKDWSNLSEGGNIKYIVKFFKDRLTKVRSNSKNKWALIHELSLNYHGEIDNLTMLDVDGQIRRFDNIAQVIKRFIDWRKTIYVLRKERLTAELTKQIANLRLRIKFIELVNEGKIVLKEIESRQHGAEILAKFDLPVEMLDIRVYMLTKEEADKARAKVKELERQLEDLAKTTIEQMYLQDLEDLRKGLVAQGYEIEHLSVRKSIDWKPDYALY